MTNRTERVFFNPPPTTSPQEGWWSRYEAVLTDLTSTARKVLKCDSRYIVERGIFGAGAPGPDTWLNNRVRTGLVMGAIQSGKTSSMFGVTAMVLDAHIDIVIILAGTRVSLWRQTYERLSKQLDAGPDSAAKETRRLMVPSRGLALSTKSYSPSQTYQMSPSVVRRSMRHQRPIIVMAMKQTDHLHALGRELRDNVFPAIHKQERPVHMVVLDDEADDGSILDAVVESGVDPIYGNLKQIPRAIANLWNPSTAVPDNLYATYVAYTATPQANLLQEDHNPLAPRDFLISLRTPLDTGEPALDDVAAPRTSTYPEPEGLASYYTGGEVFYFRGRDAHLCVPTTPSRNRDQADAVRAFLVAGAIKLYRNGKAGPHATAGVSFRSLKEARDASPAPHSMLIHPAASIDSHFDTAENLLTWAGVPTQGDARTLLDSGEAHLPDALIKSLHADPADWSKWLDLYRASATALANEFNVLTPRVFPDWPVLKKLLTKEVIPGTRVSVVNSDPSADDRPSFEPTYDDTSGRWRPARDLSTIFVSGNVMARGLTLEGLTTTLFLRESDRPLADTQMQMQRWFGYRGKDIDLCRVFADERQLDLFAAYHETDEAIRVAITERMAGAAPEPAVLQGEDFVATGKIANLGKWPLSPGPKPFITIVNDGDHPDPNIALAANLFKANTSVDLMVNNRLCGRILDTPLPLSQAADLLDGLRYDDYLPGMDSQVAKHWEQIETRLNAVQPLASSGLYRPPRQPAGTSPTTPLNTCPYSIAAYLRLWSASLTRSVQGLFVTGRPGDLWSQMNPKRLQATQPKFWVGIRYGGGASVSSGPLAKLPFHIPVTEKAVRNGSLTTTWGSNDPNALPHEYRGDEFFDYHHHGTRIPVNMEESNWRPAGSDGLILLYINRLPNQAHPALALGVCIPAGGPEQFAATRAGRVQAP